MATTDGVTQEDPTYYSKIYVGDLSSRTTYNSLRDFFTQFGDVEKVELLEYIGIFGFVTMATKAAAELALRDTTPVIDGKSTLIKLVSECKKDLEAASYVTRKSNAVKTDESCFDDLPGLSPAPPLMVRYVNGRKVAASQAEVDAFIATHLPTTVPQNPSSTYASARATTAVLNNPAAASYANGLPATAGNWRFPSWRPPSWRPPNWRPPTWFPHQNLISGLVPPQCVRHVNGRIMVPSSTDVLSAVPRYPSSTYASARATMGVLNNPAAASYANGLPATADPHAGVPTKIFVRGLNFSTTNASLCYFFKQFGDVERAVVVRHYESKKSKGFGFVTMATKAAAELALRDTTPIIDGRRTQINLASEGRRNMQTASDDK